MNNLEETTSAQLALARAVKHACMQAAKESFRDASMSGLCSEGAIEAAIGAIESLDVEEIVSEAKKDNS